MSLHNGAEITMASLETHNLSQGFTNLEKRFPAEVEVFEGGGYAHWVVYLLLVGLLCCFWRPYVPHQYRATRE